jgi:hypothetical protein
MLLGRLTADAAANEVEGDRGRSTKQKLEGVAQQRSCLVSLRQSIQRLNLRELRIACLTSAF